MKTIIIGAGSDLGVHIDGAKLGPAQLINDLKSFFHGDIIAFSQSEDIMKSRNFSDRRKNEYELYKFNSSLYNEVNKKIKEEYFPIIIGGDHSVSIASALASSNENKDIGMIWFDAHTCCNSFDTTVNGNISEMAIPTINGYKNPELRNFHKGNIIQTSKTVVIAPRQINQWEKDIVKYSGITVFTIEDIKDKGIDAIIEEAFSIAGSKTNGIHISFSLDAIDPQLAPGVSVPEEDGITMEEVKVIDDYIEKNIDKVVSYDLIDYNTLRDNDRKTEQIAVNILSKITKAVEKKSKYK